MLLVCISFDQSKDAKKTSKKKTKVLLCVLKQQQDLDTEESTFMYDVVYFVCKLQRDFDIKITIRML